MVELEERNSFGPGFESRSGLHCSTAGYAGGGLLEGEWCGSMHGKTMERKRSKGRKDSGSNEIKETMERMNEWTKERVDKQANKAKKAEGEGTTSGFEGTGNQSAAQVGSPFK